MTNLKMYQNAMKEVSKKYMNGEISFIEFKKMTKNIYVEAEPLFNTHLSEVETNLDYVNAPVTQTN